MDLRQNPELFLNIILDNNLEDVNQNLQNLGFANSNLDKQGVIEVLSHLTMAQIASVLNVDYQLNGSTSDYDADIMALYGIYPGQGQALSSNFLSNLGQFTNVFGGLLGGTSSTTTTTNTGAAADPKTSESSNTLYWVIGIIIIVVILILLFLYLRNK